MLPSKPIPTFELSLDTLQRMKPALQRLEPVLAEGDQKRIADMLAPTPELAALLNLEETVKLLVNSRDFADTKKIIEDHPELLYRLADGILAELVSIQPDEPAKKTVEVFRMILTRCKEVGVSRAILETRAKMRY
jgi:hypothetical protein